MQRLPSEKSNSSQVTAGTHMQVPDTSCPGTCDSEDADPANPADRAAMKQLCHDRRIAHECRKGHARSEIFMQLRGTISQ